MLPSHISSKELASVIGVTQRQVQLLAGKGILPQLGRDKFALGPCVQAHTAYKVAQVEERLTGEDQSYAEARRRKVLEEARALEDARKVREGRLVEIDNVVGFGVSVFTMAKNAFVRVPSKLAMQLARCREAAECEVLLRKEIYGILDRLAKGLEKPGATMPPTWREKYLEIARENSDGKVS